MIQYDNQDNPNFDFSIFDRAKIEDLEISEGMIAESGQFKIHREKERQYKAYIQTGQRTGIFLFVSLEKLFEFLENN